MSEPRTNSDRAHSADDEWPYRYAVEDVERVQGTSVKAHGIDTDPGLPDDADRDVVFAAERARQMMEHGRWDNDAPIWLGIGTRRGRDVKIDQRSMFRHVACFGTTGYGKSTLLKNVFRQIAELGAGGCFIDPGGDDSEELLEILPEERQDDVVWIEPGSTRGRVSGFNFLNPSLSPESSQFDQAVESLVADFRHMLGASQGWGPRMDGVTASLVRASAQSKYEFTPADLFYIVESPENARRFAETVRAAGLELLADSADKIADVVEQDSNALEPLWRRFKDWVESPIARQFMSLRNSPIDLAKAVENNKLIIVRMGREDRDLKQMIGTAVFRRIWSIIRARAEMDRSERSPFYLIADEFDNLATQDGAIDQMLSESRKYRLSLFLSCQYPNQIQTVLPALAANCDTWVSFSPGSTKDSRLVARNIGMDAETLKRDVNFHAWMTVGLSDQQQASEPFRLYSLPEYPPLLTRAERNELINEKLHEQGIPTQTAEEIRDAVLIRDGEGKLEQSGVVDTGSNEQLLADSILEALFVTAVRESDDNDGTISVTTDRVQEEFERRTGVELSEAKFTNQVEELYGEHVDPTREGMEKISITDSGMNRLFSQDTGSAENAGGAAHRYILRESLKTFLALGANASLPSQEGEELPDGVADLPINPLAEATSDAEYQRLKEQCETEYGRLYQISDGKDIAIEAETTTLQKPKQTLTNLRKAVEQGKKCVFACKDGSYDPDDFDEPTDAPDHTSLFEYWARRGERVIYHTEGRSSDIMTDYDTLTFVSEASIDENGNIEDRIFYNLSKEMKIKPGVGVLRPKTTKSLRWRERDNGEIVLEDKGGHGKETVRARFENYEADFTADAEEFPAYYERTADGYEVYDSNGEQMTYETKSELKQDWKSIRPPFIPEREFTDPSGNTRLPTEDDFMFLVFPDDNNDEFDGPQIYEKGGLQPLIPDDTDSSEHGSHREEETQSETLDGDKQHSTADTTRSSDDSSTATDEMTPQQSENKNDTDEYTLF